MNSISPDNICFASGVLKLAAEGVDISTMLQRHFRSYWENISEKDKYQLLEKDFVSTYRTSFYNIQIVTDSQNVTIVSSIPNMK